MLAATEERNEVNVGSRVFDLRAHRAALHARDVLIELLQDPSWLLDVRVRYRDGRAALVGRGRAVRKGAIPAEIQEAFVREFEEAWGAAAADARLAASAAEAGF